MVHARWSALGSGRVNPIVPVVVAAAGFCMAFATSPSVGAGVAIGAALAFLNGLVLSARVNLAATSGDIVRALMVMQLSLLLTLTVVGAVTVLLVKLSLSMAVAAAAGFGVTQLALLAVFYWTRGRGDTAERMPSS